MNMLSNREAIVLLRQCGACRSLLSWAKDQGGTLEELLAEKETMERSEGVAKANTCPDCDGDVYAKVREALAGRRAPLCLSTFPKTR